MLGMEVNRQTSHPLFIIKAMCTAVVFVPENLFGFSIFFEPNHLNTYRHRPLAFTTTDNLREIYRFGDIGIFSRYFSY